MVPPTLAPKPGQAATITVKAATAAMTSSARLLSLSPRRSRAPPSQAAQKIPDAA
jgi:hypothetical protein